MLSVLLSTAVIGVNAEIIKVEVDVKRGMPAFNIVGLPDTAVRESRERIIAAIKNSGFEFSSKRITINLAPADLKKEGASFDLVMALGILVSSGQIKGDKLRNSLVLGELSLSGELRKVKGVLPSALVIKKNGLDSIILSKQNAAQAAIVEDINVYPVKSLREAVEFCDDVLEIKSYKLPQVDNKKQDKDVDLKDVKGQIFVKRAMEIAASGGHNMLMIGPPGSGKTMIAKRIPTILPKMTQEEALEVTKIHSVSGILDDSVSVLSSRPFRSPHHTSSDVALIGGGSYPRPGEVSLAHNGVLFLDELPEFRRNVLEVLRQPLEDRRVVISRALRTLSYPANIMFIAAMNPCPCGYYGSDYKECTCREHQIQRYLTKISGPLWDRIDLHVHVLRITYDELINKEESESSEDVRVRVEKARDIQVNRFKGYKIYTNSNMNSNNLKKYCKLDINCRSVIKHAVTKFNLSARAYDRILKVARTIADLDSSENIEERHVRESLQFRVLDKNWWRD